MRRKHSEVTDQKEIIRILSLTNIDGFVKSRHSGENRSPETL